MALALTARASQGAEAWIADSDRYTDMLIDVHLAHSPEYGSSQGLARYDDQIAIPTLADELGERRERDAVTEKIKAQLPQANSYFYGYTRLLELRPDTEKAPGKKFDQKHFHDFILAQGLLPPNLMRKAVLEEFVPAELRARN